MKAAIQATPAYELTAHINPTPHGFDLRFISRVPTARRPEDQVKLQTVLSRDALVALRDLIDAELAAGEGGHAGSRVAA